MFRQVSSRNHRAKGFRVKYVLQISLFLAVSVWLLYQIKHSHDSKKAYEERISKNLPEFDESRADIFRFGRKDLPHKVETDSVGEARIEDEENEEVGDAEQENKRKDSENEGGGGGAKDGMDEQDRERSDEQSNNGGEVAGDKNGQAEESSLLEEQGHGEASHEAREKSFRGDDASSAVVHNTQVIENEERSHEAQEMHFKGDDAASAVSHDAQVTEHEEGSHEGREKSSNGDDASSFVELNTQATGSESEKEGSGGVAEKQLEKIERKAIENETVANGTIDGLTANYSKANDSSVILENSETTPNNNLTTNGNSVQKRESEVGTSSNTLEDGSYSNSTAGNSNNHVKQQADGGQTEPHPNSTNVPNNEMELQTNSTTTSGNTMEPHMNSTTVSNDQIASKNNLTVIAVTNGVTLQNESATLDSVQDQNGAVKTVTPSENKSNLENVVRERTENSNAAVRPEESGGSSTTSLATDDDGEKIAAESGNSFHNLAAEGNGDAHTDQPTLQGIQNKAKSDGEEATE
ncbi:dual specificity protein kinase pyk3 [Cocos nucifera]|uniref:Dual specificity protein kinase pyk3 n=1 Tax=Cocos nucifera TaxID=13894 RepID=A0A8K0ITH9_COCNU|nr:dual specificity protein kinase pyk3 [Cocos nucifera]